MLSCDVNSATVKTATTTTQGTVPLLVANGFTIHLAGAKHSCAAERLPVATDGYKFMELLRLPRHGGGHTKYC